MSPIIRLPDGDTAELTTAQMQTIMRLGQEHPGSTWHFANCGCCVCFHPGDDTTRGWIIGADGDSEYREASE